MESFKIALKGMVIGVSNVIPGVSGGTMAVVMGIYDRIIESINHFLNDPKKYLHFLIPLGIGAGLGIIIFSRVILWLFEYYPMATNFLFIGLILGGCPLLYKEAAKSKIETKNWIYFIITLSILIIFRFLNAEKGDAKVVVSYDFQSVIILFFAGLIAAFSMIIPGISGSFMLVLLGQYTLVMTIIKEFHVLLLIPIGLGVVMGGLIALRLVEYLLKSFPQQTYLAILGLVVGSIFTIYPGITANLMGLISLLAMGVGLGVSLVMSKS